MGGECANRPIFMGHALNQIRNILPVKKVLLFENLQDAPTYIRVAVVQPE